MFNRISINVSFGLKYIITILNNWVTSHSILSYIWKHQNRTTLDCAWNVWVCCSVGLCNSPGLQLPLLVTDLCLLTPWASPLAPVVPAAPAATLAREAAYLDFLAGLLPCFLPLPLPLPRQELKFLFRFVLKTVNWWKEQDKIGRQC